MTARAPRRALSHGRAGLGAARRSCSLETTAPLPACRHFLRALRLHAAPTRSVLSVRSGLRASEDCDKLAHLADVELFGVVSTRYADVPALGDHHELASLDLLAPESLSVRR